VAVVEEERGGGRWVKNIKEEGCASQDVRSVLGRVRESKGLHNPDALA
jgi:hypothetical protein